MEAFSARRITRIGVTAAIYVVLTLICSQWAYGSVQFRISEALMLLCFFNKDHITALSIGCLISNIFSTVGPIDTIVGTAATVIAGILIYVFRKEGSTPRLIICSLFPVFLNAIFVGAEITLVSSEPVSFVSVALSVAAGEFICVTVLGVILFKALEKNTAFVKTVTAKY